MEVVFVKDISAQDIKILIFFTQNVFLTKIKLLFFKILA